MHFFHALYEILGKYGKWENKDFAAQDFESVPDHLDKKNLPHNTYTWVFHSATF